MNMFVGLLFDMKLGSVFSVLAPLMALVRVWHFLGLFTMYKAFKFERFSIPIIGRMAAGLAGKGEGSPEAVHPGFPLGEMAQKRFGELAAAS